MSLRQVTIGSIAMSAVGILRMIAQMAVIPVLARYITPHDYGIMAIAMPFVLFAMMFSDAGISSSLIRTDSKQTSEWSTGFWFIVLMGLFLSLVITISGYGLSVFMSQDILFPVISCLSLSIVLQSFATVPGAALQQHHLYPTIAYIEITSIFISLISTLLAAIIGWGVWSLVVQQVVHYTVKLILTSIFSPFCPRLIFKTKEIIDHLKFGRDMLGSNFIYFLRQSIINTLMGRVLGASPVGIFSMATLFSDLPNRVVSGPLQVVLYPRMTRLKEETDSIRALYLFVSKILSIVVIPAYGMIAIAHEPVFTIVLSEKWQQAGHIFLLLAPAGILQSVTALRSTILMSLGKTQLMLRQTAESTLLTLILFVILIWFGIEWATIAVSISTLIAIPRFLHQIFPFINLTMKDYIKAVMTPAILTTLAILTYMDITLLDLSNLEKFICAFVLGGIAFLASILLQFKGLKNEIQNLSHILNKTLVVEP